MGQGGEMTRAGSRSDALAIRPPAQRRSRAAWERVLNAGVELLEEDRGYDALTIAAVCERAQVAPRAIYARASNKDALYLAVYEHAMARIGADHAALADRDRWRALPATELVHEAVGEVARLFLAHARLLRSVARTSGVHPEVLRRGTAYSHQLGELFAGLFADRLDEIDADEPSAAIWHCFNVIFATFVIRVTNGPGFAAHEVDDDRFIERLGEMACRSLLAPKHWPERAPPPRR